MYKKLLVDFRKTGINKGFYMGREGIHLNDLLGFGEDEKLWLEGSLEENFQAIDDLISQWPGIPDQGDYGNV